MVELTRSNDPVFLSWLIAHLSGDGIEAIVLDSHASVMEGSISAIQRRVMVLEEDLTEANIILAEAEEMASGSVEPEAYETV